MHSEPPGERSSRVFAWQAPSNRGPEGFQSRRRHAHAPHAVQTDRQEPRFGDLARDRTVLLVELNRGHYLLDFGQPSVLCSALPRCPRSVRINAQDARVRDNLMPGALVDEVSAALSEAFETRTTDLPSTPSSSFDTWKSSPFSSQPTVERPHKS